MTDDEIRARLAALTPQPGRRPLLPDLTPQAQLAVLCRVLAAEGYDDHIAGHITLLQGDGTLLINPWELAWDEVTASDILTLDAAGRIISGEWNVTPATPLHIEIHKRRPDVRVIIHNHPRFGTIWANAAKIPPILDQTGAYVLSEIALVDEFAGTVDQSDHAALCAEALGDKSWALLVNHGAIVVAGSIAQAHLRAVTLEWRARQAWYAAAIGGGIPVDAGVAGSLGAGMEVAGFPFLWESMARRAIRKDPGVLE